MKNTRKIMPLIMLGIIGCASRGPEQVFEASMQAFARGDAAQATRYFSKDLKVQRPIDQLEAFYASEGPRKHAAALLDKYRLVMIRQAAGTAMGKVIWLTGKTEPVYFVREDGLWKLDVPPAVREGLKPAKVEDPEKR